MKHHVILMLESLQLPDTYLIEEYNVDADDPNDVLYRGLSEEWRQLTMREVQEKLSELSFVKREFIPPTAGVTPEILEAIGGQASITELALVGTAVISIFFFHYHGLPWYRKVYNLELPE